MSTRPMLVAGTAGLVDNKASRLMLDSAYELGYRTFDTARSYAGGDSEKCLGRWLKDRRQNGRDESGVTVITKCGHPSHRNRLAPPYLKHDIDASLKALRVDCLDLVLLHRDDPAVTISTLVSFFDAAFKQGKLKSWGVSNWSHARLLQAIEFAVVNGLQAPAASSPHYSLGTWKSEPWPDCVSLSSPGRQAERDWYASTQFPVYAWSSLCGGFYNAAPHGPRELKEDKGKLIYETTENLERRNRADLLAKEKSLTTSQIVLAYLYSQPLNIAPIISSRHAEHYRQNLQAAQVRLSQDECRWLNLEVDARP